MAVRQTQKDRCIACHMPRRDSSNIAHAAVTDHMIPRLANKETVSTPPTPKPSDVPIVAYQSGKYSPNPRDAERDFGIALAKKLPSLRLDRQEMQSLAMNVKDRLTNAIKDGQADELALLSLASISAMFGDTEGRLDAAKRAIAIAPDSEEALALLTVTYVYAKQFDEALALADRLVKMVPSAIDHRLLRASVLIGKRDWIAAEKACREAQAINPLSAESHLLRAMCLDALGKADEAKKEADVAFALETNPEIQRQYRSMFRPKRQ